MIRKFESPDMDDILRIWLEASIKTHDFIDADFWQSKIGDMRHKYIPNSETYVYTDKGVIKGFFALYEDTLAALFVSPDSQRTGIGKKLITIAKSLRETLNLYVYRKNSKAIDFYIKCGFRTLKTRVDKHTGEIEILMTCYDDPCACRKSKI